jgi:hypothetical protein
MRVCPRSHVHRRRQVDYNASATSRLADGGLVFAISLQPPIEVHLGGQQVALIAIAVFVSENKVVRKIARIT